MGAQLETVQAIYEAFGRGDVPAILERLGDDVRWEAWNDNRAQGAGVPWLEELRGRDAVGRFFAFVGSWQIHDFRVLSLMEGERQVGAEIEIDATVTQTGERLHDQELHLWTFGDDGKVERFRHYVDTAKHMAAAHVGAVAG
jgi:ketosteroid isomerase-like protein